MFKVGDMKVVTYIFFLFAFILSEPKPPKKLKPKPNPPGTVQLNDTLYIDINFVTNRNYKEFTNFLNFSYSRKVRDTLDKLPLFGVDKKQFYLFMKEAGKDKEFIKRMQIRLDQKLSWAMSLEEYINSPLYLDHPIVCVTFSQAEEYCRWKTRMVMLQYATMAKKEKQRKKYYTRIQYRLPKPEEWDLAMDKFSQNVITNKSIFPPTKVMTLPTVPQPKKPTFFYVPGNISEMTNIENLAVGVSWKDADTITNYKQRVNYLGARDWLGFRCVCEIIEY